MSDSLLERVGLLAEIACQKKDKQGRLGKTAMQKLLYLLQEAYHVPLGYRFSLYTYGPYDSQVMNDLDYADAIGALAIDYNDDGYSIKLGSQEDQIEQYREKMTTEHGDALTRLLDAYGDLNARELELRSTLFYIAHEEDGVSTRPELVLRLKGLKPKFPEDEIEKAVDDLITKDHLAVSFSS